MLENITLSRVELIDPSGSDRRALAFRSAWITVADPPKRSWIINLAGASDRLHGTYEATLETSDQRILTGTVSVFEQASPLPEGVIILQGVRELSG